MRSRTLLVVAVVLALGIGLGVLSPRLLGALGAGHPGGAQAAAAADEPERRPPAPPPAPEPSDEPTPEPTAEPTPEPTAEPPAAASPAATPTLLGRLAEVLSDPALPVDGRLAVSILDSEGRVVLDHHAGASLMPASTQKLLVAAAALGALGADFRYETRVAASAPVGADGVIAGDLVLVGGGDPALASPTFMEQVHPERPATPLAALADQIVAAGVRHVTGGVYGDPRVLADEPLPSGWLDSYLTDLDGTRVSGLTVDAGRQMFWRAGRLQGVPAPDPAAEAAAALHTLLVARGVVIDGGATATRTPPAAAVPLGAVHSPPLGELLRWMVQRSDNGIAEGVFRSLGAAAGDPTWAGAAEAVRMTLAPLGLDWTGATLADGSGLSRDDRVTAGLLSALDVRMTRSDVGTQWHELMAVAGRSGTLRRRLLGTVAEGRLRGKTGSLRDVRSLAGLVVGPDGAGYHFAIVGNDLDDPAQIAVRALQDELVLALAEDLYGCVRIPLPPPTPAPGTTPDPAAPPPEPAFELSCAA